MRSVQLKPLISAVKRSVFTLSSMLCLLLLPGIGFSQEPGSNPDVPVNVQGVPFDSTMNIALLVVGVVFAVYRLRQIRKKKASLIK